MNHREQAMARFQELANRLVNPEHLLHACLTPTASYGDYLRSDREPVVLASELAEEAKLLYKAIAVAPELSSFAKQRICLEACGHFLAKAVGKEEWDTFKRAHPLRDNYDPDFVDLNEALARVEDSGIPDTVLGQGWNLQVAAKILQVALGDTAISERSCDQLWKHIARKFKDECSGSFEEGHHGGDVLSRTANRILVTICYVANSHRYKVEQPIDFSELEVAAFRD